LNGHRPETDQHLRAADRNLGLASALMNEGIEFVTPPAYDWVLIIAFYAAVRYINAYDWERFGYDPADHQARNGFVNRVRELQPIASAFDALYGRSRIVRYRISSPVNASAAHAAIGMAERIRDTVIALLSSVHP
jgi:hypothetical protein